MTISPETALVLFSGGQDSTVCLAWALERFSRVETIGFDYGQRHAVELAVRPPSARGARRACAPNGRRGSARTTSSSSMRSRAISDTALTRRHADRNRRKRPADHLRARAAISSFSVSPVRSPTGAAPAISSPACARPTIPAIPIAATTPSRPCRSRWLSAWTRRFVIHTPLMWIDKAADLRHGGGDRRRGAAQTRCRGDP